MGVGGGWVGILSVPHGSYQDALSLSFFDALSGPAAGWCDRVPASVSTCIHTFAEAFDVLYLYKS